MPEETGPFSAASERPLTGRIPHIFRFNRIQGTVAEFLGEMQVVEHRLIVLPGAVHSDLSKWKRSGSNR